MSFRKTDIHQHIAQMAARRSLALCSFMVSSSRSACAARSVSCTFSNSSRRSARSNSLHETPTSLCHSVEHQRSFLFTVCGNGPFHAQHSHSLQGNEGFDRILSDLQFGILVFEALLYEILNQAAVTQKLVVSYLILSCSSCTSVWLWVHPAALPSASRTLLSASSRSF